MTWKEIKDAIEAEGVQDEDEVAYIDMQPFDAGDISAARRTPEEGWQIT